LGKIQKMIKPEFGGGKIPAGEGVNTIE